MALAVHPDDETLGCGGTLLRHAAQGDSLHWVVLTSAPEDKYDAGVIAQYSRQVESIAAAYPFATVDRLGFPSTRLETVPFNDIVEALRGSIERVRPDLLFIPNRSDVHSDHRVAFHAACAVTKSFYMRTLGVRRVLACEVLSETDAAPAMPEGAFLPNVYVDISGVLARKIELMSRFESEVHPRPLPREASAIEALARYRGASIGVEYAEAFMLIREVL